MSWGNQIRNLGGTYNERKNVFTKELVGQLSLSLIVKSPVGDPSLWKSKPPKGYDGGQFRANWQLGVGEINPVTSNARDKDGGPTLDKIVGSIPENAGGKVYFITNSLPYALPLENGHSTQAPLGMVTLTVIEFGLHVSAAIERARLTGINGREFGL